MNRSFNIKYIFMSILFVFASQNSLANTQANHKKITPPVTVQHIFKSAQKNQNWKTAFLTAKHMQVVFMSISPSTNPKNEIGMETHPFDQIILVAEGKGKALLNGKTSEVKSGDLIFIPQGVHHNVINLSPKNPLKIISFYSSNDIPANSTYKTKSLEKE